MDLVAALFPLFVEWAKERRDQRREMDTEAFRSWLQEAAFPELLAASERQFATLVSLKAQETERFEILLGFLKEIRSQIAQAFATPQAIDLRPLDQVLLEYLYRHDDPDCPGNFFEKKDLVGAVPASADELRAAARYLQEKGLVQTVEASGGFLSVNLEAPGTLLAWSKFDGGDRTEAEQRIIDALLSGSETLRAGDLAQRAGLPLRIVLALLAEWADGGLLRLEDGAYPPFLYSVFGVSESLRRLQSTRG